MNNKRRQVLSEICSALNEKLEELEEIITEEEESRDNIPESLWNSEKYESSESASSDMEEVRDNLSDAISLLRDLL